MTLDYKTQHYQHNQDRLQILINGTNVDITSASIGSIESSLQYFLQTQNHDHKSYFIKWLKQVLEIDNSDEIIEILSKYQLDNFLITQFQDKTEINDQIQIIELLGILLEKSNRTKVFTTCETLSFLLSTLNECISASVYMNINLIFHLLYAIFSFLKPQFLEILLLNDFFDKICSLLGTSAEIDTMIMQFSLKLAEYAPLNNETFVNLLCRSMSTLNEYTADMISLTLYLIYKRDQNILDNDLFVDLLVKCLSFDEEAQKFILKLLTRIDPQHFKIVGRAEILSYLYNIFQNYHENSNNKLLATSLRIVYRIVQLSSSYAEAIFFPNNDENIMNFIIQLILNSQYLVRNEAIKLFSLLIHFLPHLIKPFFINADLFNVFRELIHTILDVNNYFSSLFITSLDSFIHYAEANEIILEFSRAFQSPDILEKIRNMSESENEDLKESLEIFSETLTDLLDRLE
ncbi:hypothetical protein TRFO_19879 [Tritrichomonas foetus]|uniref:Uncharacterized protein n=1 Tax=Tritrichomonas foetus TaxID=1144522 RepID=A0A1J4KI78_9EUKA|nr:hypothetical protein TRFO_19879 [Tritrichomonas foetus]|eukprot:OHT10746.1 hypothetical protein TRFO_19879 [Tritrichomonas foetus]